MIKQITISAAFMVIAATASAQQFSQYRSAYNTELYGRVLMQKQALYEKHVSDLQERVNDVSELVLDLKELNKEAGQYRETEFNNLTTAMNKIRDWADFTNYSNARQYLQQLKLAVQRDIKNYK